MNWINNIVSDLQKRFFGGEESITSENSGMLQLDEYQTLKKVQQFQARLVDLDRRLSELR